MLTGEGFFAVEIPEPRWADVIGKGHDLVVRDAGGDTVVERCLRMYWSPDTIAAEHDLPATGSSADQFVSPNSTACAA